MKMKILNFLSALLFCFLISNIHLLMSKKFNNNSSIKSLSDSSMRFSNALKILQLGSNNFIGKILFMFKSQTDKRPQFPLNKLNYKIIQITQTELIIYSTVNQFEAAENDESELNLSNYLMTIKLKNIDLPCNDYLFLCKLGEFKKKYISKMPDIEFDTNENILRRFSDAKANSNCLILTTGPFQTVKELPYLCFHSLEHLIFIQNLLTERILRLSAESYAGAAEILNQEHDAFNDGVLELKPNELIYYFNKQKLVVEYNQVVSYAASLYNNEKIPWKGSSFQSPEPARCFRIKLRSQETLYFCNHYSRKDVARKHLLTTSNSVFVGNIFIAILNRRLHNYNLRSSQDGILKAEKLTCDSSEMESIKYEIRFQYLIVRHKIAQLLTLKKLPMDKGLEIIEKRKSLIINSVCLSNQLCINTAETCIKKGMLPLKIKGYQLATSLQNPYIARIPKSSLKSGESNESRRLFGKELMEESKQFFGGKKYVSDDSENFNETDYSSNTFEIPSSDDIKKAFNTFYYIFENRKGRVEKLEEFGQYCRIASLGNTRNLKRKIHYLSNSPVNDPFFDYLGKIRNDSKN